MSRVQALVTGGRGFVGRHLVDHLIAQGDEVVAIDLERDVADPVAMSEVVATSAPDAVYHLAALAHVGQSWDDPTDVLRVNVLGTAVVLAALRAHAPHARTVVVSSAEVYGTVSVSDLPLSETAPARPSSPYAASKLAAEAVALQAARGFGQEVVVVRAFNHIGPGQSPAFFVPGIAARLVRARAEGAHAIPVGNLAARRDFTDVRDVVRAYRMLATHGMSGEIYNVASGIDHEMATVAAALRDLVDASIAFTVDSALLRPSDVPVLRGDARKLRAATGWSPAIDLATTLADVVAAVSVAA